MEITWQEPPSPEAGRKKGVSKYTPIVKGLMANPGKWALVIDVTNVRTPPPPHFFTGPSFERAYRTVDIDGVKHRRVYIRYIGEPDEV